MKNPLLKAPLLLNIGILIVSGIISAFTLTFGLAHLFEGTKQAIGGTGPDIPAGESILGFIIVILLCVIGIASLIIAIAAIKGIINNFKKT